MSSKQMSVLMKNTEQQYLEGSPILLEACALYLDNASGNCVAQLKWKSIDDKPIKAVMIELVPFDAFTEKLASVTYQYNGLDVNKGNSFGDKNGIQIKGNQANRYDVFLKAVAFHNGEIWRNNITASFSPLPARKVQQLMGKYFQQYKRELVKMGCEAAAKFTPQRALGLWQCGCGSWQKESDMCLRCSISYDALRAASDKENLDHALQNYAKEQERLKIEAQEAEERRIQAEIEEKERIEKEKKAEIVRKELAKAKTKKICVLSAIAVAAVIAVVLLLTQLIIPKGHYDKGIQYYQDSNWDMATTEFEQAGSYSDARTKRKDAQYQKGIELQRANNFDEAIAVFEGIYDYKDASTQYQESIYQSVAIHLDSNDILYAQQWVPKVRGYRDGVKYDSIIYKKRDILKSKVTVCGYTYLVCLRNDGTVYISGADSELCNTVRGWKNIIQVAADHYSVYGLRVDGKVEIANGKYHKLNGLEEVKRWTDIVAISVSDTDVVGLKSNRTVVSAKDFGEKANVSEWTNVVRVITGRNRVVGIQGDGTVLLAGRWKPIFTSWDDIIDVAVTNDDVYGLKKDGTVIAKEKTDRVASWRDIVDIESTLRGDESSLIGIHSNGSVITLNGTWYNWDSCDDWSDIVSASIAPYHHFVGVKRDGRMVAIGEKDESSRYRVSGWKDVIAVITNDFMTVGIQNNGNVIITADDYGHYNGDAVCNLYYSDIQ